MQLSAEIVHFDCEVLDGRKEKRGSKKKRKQSPSCHESQECVSAHRECDANAASSSPPSDIGDGQVVATGKKKRRRKKIAADARGGLLVPTTQQRTTFQSLCDDVLVEILLFLRPRTIFRASLTCKAFASAAQGAGLWRRLYIKHSSCDLTQLCRMAMPCTVWRSLYKSMFLSHVSEKRAKKRKRNKAASDATKNQWTCPEAGCSATFENQGLLHQHLRKHFKESFSTRRHYCPHQLCCRFFPEARGAVVHSTQSCPFRPEVRGGPWSCSTCDALFVYYDAYRAHLGPSVRCPSPPSGNGSRESSTEPDLAPPPPPAPALGRRKKRRGTEHMASLLSSHLPPSLRAGSASIADALRRGSRGEAAGEGGGAAAGEEGQSAAVVAGARSEVVEVVTREGRVLLAGRAEQDAKCEREGEVEGGGRARYHGVRLHEGKWRAEVQVHGFRVTLGKFADPRCAAVAYDTALLLLASHMQRRPAAKGPKLNFKDVVPTPSMLSAVERLVASHLASNPRVRAASSVAKRAGARRSETA